MSDNVIGFPHGNRPGDVYEEPINEPNPNEAPSVTEEFFNHLRTFSHLGLAIATNKNQDYAGNGDPFANFRASEQVGVPAPRAMLVRMQDKMQRLSNLLTRPPAVANESLIDSCIDLSNYALILATYIKMHPEPAE